MNNYYIQGYSATVGAMIGMKILDPTWISWEALALVAMVAPMWIAVDHFINHRKK